MAILLTHLRKPFAFSRSCILFSRSISSFEAVEKAIKCAVETKEYLRIPDLVVSLKEPYQNSMLFSFLSAFHHHHRIRVIDEILQSFVPVRPRSLPKIVYSSLLTYCLQSSDPLPLSFAILQRTLRSGCLPNPQTHLLLSDAWLERRRGSQSVADIINEMKLIGYSPDTGTCNYLVSSLCAVDKLDEAVKVVEEMGAAGCIPDVESYGAVINSLCLARKTNDVVNIVKEMVSKAGISPRKGMLTKVASALRANRETWKAIEMIEFVESRDYPVEFESYEVLVEGCLEVREYILAGKMVMRMTDRGFIPYIKVRQKVVERLISIGEWKLACTVRERLSELKS
ncbi:PREDICTED: pentatricopeptide repeat-containing protein At1g06270-like [Camelina sativa]|uniref:Pentatricopeptide repeat-containing protein At1g06270-like n=1 Tax=Camelina sativa TaxID=90675 RepID=A0ABM0VKW3_CAMSA|nr:PREDICTED: pentatricopeptide repeat-containing protein At1g06270-like [Camelina sativa]